MKNNLIESVYQLWVIIVEVGGPINIEMARKYALLVLLASLFVASSLVVNQLKGYVEQNLYLATTECANTPSAYVSSSWGECVKIFAGPEDPTTELTSYRLNIGDGTTTGQIVLEKNFFSDSKCTKANGQQTFVAPINQCFSADPNSVQYNNATQSADLPVVFVSGLAVLGFQEYNTCSQNRQVTNRIVYPNDQCNPSEGKTKRGDKYFSYSIYCASNVLTTAYFSDAACQSSIPNSSTSSKLGGGDTTCATNQGDDLDSDINLFQTYTCTGNAPTRELQGNGGEENFRAHLGIRFYDVFASKN